MEIKCLNDILNLKHDVVENPTNEEIIKAFSKPIIHGNSSHIFVGSEETVNKFREVLDEYEKNKKK